jgi:hypothetical protein
MELQQLIKNWTKEMTELKDEIRDYEHKTGKPAISAEARLQAISEIMADVKQLNLPHVNSLLDEDNDIDTVGICANCGVEFHIHKRNYFETCKCKGEKIIYPSHLGNGSYDWC